MYRKSFYFLATSQAINLISNSMMRFAISLFVLDLTGSAAAFATMLAISFAPMIICTPVGGAVADIFPKKFLLIFYDSVTACVILLLWATIFFEFYSMAVITAMLLLLTIVSSGYNPMVNASLPAMLEADWLVKANGIVQGISAFSMLAGPMFAGLLFAAIGIENLLLLCVILAFFSIVIDFFTFIPHKADKRTDSMIRRIFSDLKTGFLYVSRENRNLFDLAVIFAAALFFFQAVMTVTFPYVIRVSLGMSEELFGFSNTAVGASSLLASLMAGRLKKILEIKSLPKFMFIMAVLLIFVVVSVLEINTYVAYISITVGKMSIMFLFTLINITVLSHVQRAVPADMVGKTIAIISALANMAVPAGQMVLGRLITPLDGLGLHFVLYVMISVFTLFLAGVSRKKVS
ncbi:MAG: MFS transporter [Turicibacter sp.]|nr:MFS transporter [Turicibacter sp.]